MYKKRFMKWGFQKNSKISPANADYRKMRREYRKVASNRAGSMALSPKSSHSDSQAMLFLATVRTWSVAFFESVKTDEASLASEQYRLASRPRRPSTKEMSFAFKLTIDLLDRHQGNLAGRMARKAFILVEDILMLEAPAAVWNLLEVMHHMVTLRHVKLFHMLLEHLIALVRGKFPTSHPFHSMLRCLQGAFRGLSSPVSEHSPVVLSLLERAWALNTELLFEHFNSRHFQLYLSIVCDACSIRPPAALFAAGGPWFDRIEAHQTPGIAVEDLFTGTAGEEDIMLQRLLSPRKDISPPRTYGMLHASSIAALHKHGQAALSQGASFSGDTAILLRMLAGLAAAKALKLLLIDNPKTTVSRLQAGNLACAVGTLGDLRAERVDGDLRTSPDDIERIRTVVALRAYSEGETDPQVVREMWLLRDALMANSELEEAREVERDAYRRMEKYLQEIPVDSA